MYEDQYDDYISTAAEINTMRSQAAQAAIKRGRNINADEIAEADGGPPAAKRMMREADGPPPFIQRVVREELEAGRAAVLQRSNASSGKSLEHRMMASSTPTARFQGAGAFHRQRREAVEQLEDHGQQRSLSQASTVTPTAAAADNGEVVATTAPVYSYVDEEVDCVDLAAKTGIARQSKFHLGENIFFEKRRLKVNRGNTPFEYDALILTRQGTEVKDGKKVRKDFSFNMSYRLLANLEKAVSLMTVAGGTSSD